jgi:hypothetical protein
MPGVLTLIFKRVFSYVQHSRSFIVLMNMKKNPAWFLCLLLFFSCNNNKNIPDVSGIKVDLPIERFEQSFFTIDSNDISGGLKKIQQRYPDFYPDFMREILGVSGVDTNAATLLVTREFLIGYLPVYETLTTKYKNITWLQKELEKAFQFVKYYFPEYKTGKAITFIGPFDAPGTALTKSGLAIGLHQYAGKDFPVYQSTIGQQLYPTYISRRFEPEYITANCMKSIVQDLFPDNSTGKGLIEQMIAKGKQWWLLDKFMPEAPDSVKTVYTQKQLEWCREYEGLIWQTIITNEKDIHTIEPVAIQNYIGDAPFTPNMPAASPGNIGQWVGLQIVKKFAEKNPGMKPREIMEADAKRILEEAKYKPK